MGPAFPCKLTCRPVICLDTPSSSSCLMTAVDRVASSLDSLPAMDAAVTPVSPTPEIALPPDPAPAAPPAAPAPEPAACEAADVLARLLSRVSSWLSRDSSSMR